jgi:hypothetical protein
MPLHPTPTPTGLGFELRVSYFYHLSHTPSLWALAVFQIGPCAFCLVLASLPLA